MSSISQGRILKGEASGVNKPGSVRLRDKLLFSSNDDGEARRDYRRAPTLSCHPTPYTWETASVNSNHQAHLSPPSNTYSARGGPDPESLLPPAHQTIQTSHKLPRPAISINDRLDDHEPWSSYEDLLSAQSRHLVSPRRPLRNSSTRPHLPRSRSLQSPPARGPQSIGEILTRPRPWPKPVALADPEAEKETLYHADESSDSSSSILGRRPNLPPQFQDSEDSESDFLIPSLHLVSEDDESESLFLPSFQDSEDEGSLSPPPFQDSEDEGSLFPPQSQGSEDEESLYSDKDSDSDSNGETLELRERVGPKWRPLLDDLADLLGGEQMYCPAFVLLCCLIAALRGTQLVVSLRLLHLIFILMCYFAVLTNAAVGLESVESISISWYEYCSD
ncbi:MAG: hypothetical protein Q9165_004001 [Trypethelium subeluteriae]